MGDDGDVSNMVVVVVVIIYTFLLIQSWLNSREEFCKEIKAEISLSFFWLASTSRSNSNYK